MSQLGFTFYPKDWWTSDSFFTLNPFERYIYLELLFMMYVNDGFVANNKVNVERRLFTTIKEDVWLKITDLLVKEGDQLTHRSVNARLRKTLANRENGKKGGAPIGNSNAEKQPKQPNISTHETTQNNPPSEKNRIEVNRKEKKGKEIKEIKENSLPPAPHPDYLKFQDWIKANAPRVAKMEKPITEKEFMKLKDEFGHQVMMDYLTRMENYKPLLKNSTSANLTLRKWIAGDKEKKQQSDLPIYKQGMVR